jgi:hypothetical protein
MKQVISLLTAGDTAKISLHDLMQYRITSVSLALFTPDGIMVKTVKSTFTKVLTLQPVAQIADGYHAIVDMGMVWNKVLPQGTWSDFAQSLLMFVRSRHPAAQTIHFINDIYDEQLMKNSIKQHEQQRRSKSHGFAPNVYPAADQKMPIGKFWRSFLSKSSNKSRLQQFLLKQWTCSTLEVDMLYTLNLDCYDLRNGQVCEDFKASSPCEADSRAASGSSLTRMIQQDCHQIGTLFDNIAFEPTCRFDLSCTCQYCHYYYYYFLNNRSFL